MGPRGKDYNVLHSVYCRWVVKSNVNVPKYFFNNIEEAMEWLLKNRGEEGKNWKRCGTCHAEARPRFLVSPESKLGNALKSVHVRRGPFTEKEVEEILIQHLKDGGYKVRRQVPVTSGKVDVVADGPDGYWFIEVKGEDKGEYTSAEMNFQIGVGQIVSRMTEPSVSYALAFPMTSNFKSVLRKYKGSSGFERLNLKFFVIHGDGKVNKYDSATIRTLIDSV